jgi:hypothetical protein
MCAAISIVIRDVSLEGFLVAETLRVPVYGRPGGSEGRLSPACEYPEGKEGE